MHLNEFNKKESANWGTPNHTKQCSHFHETAEKRRFLGQSEGRPEIALPRGNVQTVLAGNIHISDNLLENQPTGIAIEENVPSFVTSKHSPHLLLVSNTGSDVKQTDCELKVSVDEHAGENRKIKSLLGHDDTCPGATREPGTNGIEPEDSKSTRETNDNCVLNQLGGITICDEAIPNVAHRHSSNNDSSDESKNRRKAKPLCGLSDTNCGFPSNNSTAKKNGDQSTFSMTITSSKGNGFVSGKCGPPYEPDPPVQQLVLCYGSAARDNVVWPKLNTSTSTIEDESQAKTKSNRDFHEIQHTANTILSPRIIFPNSREENVSPQSNAPTEFSLHIHTPRSSHTEGILWPSENGFLEESNNYLTEFGKDESTSKDESNLNGHSRHLANSGKIDDKRANNEIVGMTLLPSHYGVEHGEVTRSEGPTPNSRQLIPARMSIPSHSSLSSLDSLASPIIHAREEKRCRNKGSQTLSSLRPFKYGSSFSSLDSLASSSRESLKIVKVDGSVGENGVINGFRLETAYGIRMNKSFEPIQSDKSYKNNYLVPHKPRNHNQLETKRDPTQDRPVWRMKDNQHSFQIPPNEESRTSCISVTEGSSDIFQTLEVISNNAPLEHPADTSPAVDFTELECFTSPEGNLAFAMELYENAVKNGHLDNYDTISEGNNHILAAKAYSGLGFARQCKGELDSCLDAYLKSLHFWETEFGQLDPRNACLQYTIGTVLYEMQHQFESSVHLTKALRLLKSQNISDEGTRANVLSVEGMLFSVTGETDRALECFQQALVTYQSCSCPLNLKFATVLFEMGSLLSSCNDNEDSAYCFQSALNIRKAKLGDSFVVARTHYSLGVALASQDSKGDAASSASFHLEEALRICQVEFGSQNLQSAVIIHAMGVLNERKGDFPAASAWFTKELNTRKLLVGQDHETVASVSSDLGTCYYNSGKYELALSLFKDALRIRLLSERSGSLEIADLKYKIASCLESLCYYDEALRQFYEVKRIRESHFGVESSPVIQTMIRIGNIHLGKGEANSALDCFNEILGIGYTSDSVNAIEVANALYGRGCAQFCDYMLTDAMKSFGESLNWKLAALGEDDPGLACIFYQMAHVYLEQSEPEEAITCFEEYARLRKLETKRNLHDNAEICFTEGIVAKLNGRTDAALSYYNQSLAMFETLFGMEHEKVASIQFDIGCVHLASYNYNTAIDYFQICLMKRRKLLGCHVDVASVLYEMTSAYIRQGEVSLATACLEECVKIWKLRLEGSEKMASVCRLSGKLWKSLRRYDEAEEDFKRALELAVRIHGQNHESVAAVLLDLGELLQETGQMQQALFCFDESVQICIDLSGPKDLNVARGLYSKGVVLIFQGDFADASHCLGRSLEIRKEKLGCLDSVVGDTLNTIGFLQLRMGNIYGKEALEPLLEALKIRKSVGNLSKVASTLQNIGSVYKKRRELDLCMNVYSDLLAIRQKEFGTNDERVAEAWISLGNVQTSSGRIVEATLSYEEALRIRTLLHGYNHKSVAQVIFKIGLLNSKRNYYTEAKQLFEEYIRIRAEEEDEPDEEMAHALTLTGDLQNETGEKSKAQVNWMSALDIYHQLGYSDSNPKVAQLRSRQKTLSFGLFGETRRGALSFTDLAAFSLLGG